MNQELYRIISFPMFVNLIEKREEWFARPASWEDTYEGYWFQTLNSDEQIRKAVEILFNNVSPNNFQATVANFFKLWAIKYTCFGQCWSKIKDSDALWRIYSYDKSSIQIISTESKIRERLKHKNDVYDVIIDDVEYNLKDGNLLQIQAESIKNTQRAAEPYFQKRDCFSHEEEKRVILMDKQYGDFLVAATKSMTARNISDLFKNSNLPKEEIIDKLSTEIKETLNRVKITNDSKGENITINDKMALSDYIVGVRVNPFADEWVVSLVETLCKKNGIDFLGKSEMYAVVK